MRGFVDAALIEDAAALGNFENEEFAINRQQADGTFLLDACVPDTFPSIVVVEAALAHLGFRAADAAVSDGAAPTPDQVVVMSPPALPTSPARAQTVAQTKAKSLSELIAVCLSRLIAKRIADLDYTPLLLQSVTLEELLSEFDPPLCTNVGQHRVLSRLCMVASEVPPTATTARLPRPLAPPSPPASARRATCGHVSRRSPSSAPPYVPVADEMHSRHHSGAFGANSDDDEVEETPRRLHALLLRRRRRPMLLCWLCRRTCTRTAALPPCFARWSRLSCRWRCVRCSLL